MNYEKIAVVSLVIAFISLALSTSIISDNSKVNKSGDNMTGYLNLKNNSAGLIFQNETKIIGSLYQVDYMHNYQIDAFVMNLNRQVINGSFSCDSSYCDAPGGSLQIVSDKYNNASFFAYYIFYPNQTTYAEAFQLGSNGLNLKMGVAKISALAGSGDTFVCAHNDGTLYNC